jgi:hypothetical protein
MNYTPETRFKVSGDNRLVYNLRGGGWKKGEPVMLNDIAVSIEARHLPEEVQARIAFIISVALNREFVNGRIKPA